MAFLLVASAILFVTRSESSFPVASKAFHYLDVPRFIVLTLLLALKIHPVPNGHLARFMNMLQHSEVKDELRFQGITLRAGT